MAKEEKYNGKYARLAEVHLEKADSDARSYTDTYREAAKTHVGIAEVYAQLHHTETLAASLLEAEGV